MKRFSTPRAFAAISVLLLGLAAASGFAAPARDDHHGTGRELAHTTHAYATFPMFHERALTRLHDELKLDAQQETLWKETSEFSRERHDAIRARMDKGRAEIRALLEEPGSDLRAVAGRMDELRAEGLKLRDTLRDRWLTVFDALDAGQKEKVRLFFRDGAKRLEGRADRNKKGPRRGHGRRDTPAPKD
ncbi:MAG: periplasmic heavy metal sensor [Candidatus Accumulibacter sp.]|nr:periplasmic heavy metal sensor [Accumulibacter sp.]